MIRFQGKGICGNIVIGRICVFKRQNINVSRADTADTANEIKRFEQAKKKAREQLSALYEKVLKELGEDNADIFEIHMMMLDDDDYNESVRSIIETQSVNAEYALKMTADKFSQMFMSMDDDYMRARADDVKDISNRVIACLSGADWEREKTDGKFIICADDFAPSEIVSLDRECILAFVTAHGSINSHTAILARNMNITAVIGAGDEFLTEIHDGGTLIADGCTGSVIVSPDDKTLAQMRTKQTESLQNQQLLQKLKGKENITLDGTLVDIFANISGINDIDAAIEHDAGGIGLFRSEFLYLENGGCPSEKRQFQVYSDVLKRMAGRKVIIRTADIGADKQFEGIKAVKEPNPALGLRAVRFYLTYPEIFRTQMRALYRASVYGNLGILFPMITSVSEVEQILSVCESVKSELRDEGIPYSDKTELGIMIETPAAAIVSDLLAPAVDFFSIGTNDLTQYTLACDRQNADLEPFYNTRHEAVFRLIEATVKNAHRYGKWVGICGELAADTSLTERFLRIGVDEISASPQYILPLRNKVRSLNLSEK